MFSFRTFLLLLATCFGPTAHAQDQLTLISPNATPQIIIASTATESEKYAARELSEYLEKISGKAVAIHTDEATAPATKQTPHIIIGHHPQNADLHPETLGEEESIISVESNRVRIVGGQLPPVVSVSGSKQKPVHTIYVQDRGTLYGVYELLDQLGVRWYRPDPWGEYVPSLPTITLPLGKRNTKPAYKYRYGLHTYQDKKSQTPEQAQWMNRWLVRNRLSVASPQFGGAYRTAFHHNYMYLVPHERYFKTNPEYFALINGKRSDYPRAQLCLGNSEVQNLVAAQIIAQAKKNPQQSIFSIDPNDRTYWCECELCRAMDDPALLTPAGKVSMANRVTAFGNIIAKKLAAEVPGAKVGWRAYAMHTETPTKVKALEPNTAVEATAFAGMYSDYSRPLLDPKSKQNAAFVKVLEGYGPLTELLVHEYYSGYAWYGPLPVLSTMKDRFSQYRNFGVQGVSSESHPSWGPQGITHYFYARLMWNPDLDLDKELEEYCRNYYGPAAAPMLQYHRLLDEEAQKGPRFGSGGSYLAALFNDALLARMTPLIEQAKATAQQESYRRRVEGDWAGYEVARLIAQARNAKRRHQPEQALQTIEQMKQFVLSYKEGDVFDNSPAIFRYVTLTMLSTSALNDLEKQESPLSKDYQETRLLQSLDAEWRLNSDPANNGLHRGFANNEFGDTQWQPATVTAPWQEQGFPNFTGTMWYRRNITVPSIANPQRLLLSFGAADGDAVVYLNGVKVGEHLLGTANTGWNQPFIVDITKALRPGAANVLAVQVTKKDGNGGLYQGVDLWQGIPKNNNNNDWQDF